VASNIRVVLEIDNKQYIADLNKADAATQKFASTVNSSANSANTGFNKLNASSSGLNLNLGKLSSVVGAGLATGFVITAKSAIQMANAIDDLSKATGFAIDNIVGFQQAVGLAGGNAEQAAKGLTFFFQQIDSAASGSAAAQIAFAKLGITLGDLSMLTEQQLFQTTVEQLAKIGPSAAKTALQGELLGKAFRNITIDQEFLDNLRSGQGEAAKLSQAVQRATLLNDQFEKSWASLRIAFLEVFGPIISGLASVAEALTKSTLLTQGLGVALLAIPGFAAGRAVFSGLSFITKGLFGAKKAADVASKSVGAVGSSAKTAVDTAKKSSSSIKDALQVAGNSGIAQSLKARLALITGLAGAGTAVGLGTAGRSKIADAETEKQQADAKAAAAAAAMEGKAQREVTSAIAAKTAAIKESSQAYQDQVTKGLRSIEFENSLIGKSKEFADAERARQDAMTKSSAEIDKLTTAKANMSKEDRELGLGSVYDAQIAKIKQTQSADAEKFAAASQNSNKLVTLEGQRLFGLQQEYDLQNKLYGLQNQIATTLLPEIERRYKGIETEAQAAARARVQEEQTRLGRTLTGNEEAAIYRATAQQVDVLKVKTKELFDVENLRSLRDFTITSRVQAENQLVDIQNEMAKSTLPEIQRKYFDIEAAARAAGKAAVDAEEQRRGQKLDPAEARAFYDAAAVGVQNLQAVTASAYESSRTFATGWTQAFNEYADAAYNAANNAKNIFATTTKGMEDMIVNFTKTGKLEFKSFLGSIVEQILRSQIQQVLAQSFKIGGASSGGSSFFGDLFSAFISGGSRAAGGPVSAGRAYTVGESGPETFVPTGAGSVVPGTGATSVTYNINAVDASSFRTLVASDPEFIFAVTEQGRRRFPASRRQ
jgi:hypothetical protein